MINHQQALHQLTNAFSDIPFNRLLGLQLNEPTAAQVTMHFSMQKELIGNFLQGILHGGVISSVLDMAGGMLVMSALIHQQPEQITNLAELIGKTSTIDLQVSFLRPGRGKTFFVTATLIKMGKQLAFTRMELCNEMQVLIATASGTYTLK